MVDAGIFHNGEHNIPLKEAASGRTIPDASVAEIHANCQQVVRDQIEHAIHAEQIGLDRVFFTEHHFQPHATEFSTNPLLSQMYVAAKTDTIRLAQLSNILPWHDPVRLAEQTAVLDIMSDGRAEVGIGRGYQPRENEVLGQYWGGTVQDDTKNRVTFEEKYDIMLRAWTEDFISVTGDYHAIPPKHTMNHHFMDHDYLDDPVSDPYEVSDMIDWESRMIGAQTGHVGGGGEHVQSGKSFLNSLFVAPKPLQEPHPQIWMPLSSEQSTRWAARNGINAFVTLRPVEAIKPLMNAYYEEAEEHGWYDRRDEYDGEPLVRGWDEEKQRGLPFYRMILDTDYADDDLLERWKAGVVNFIYWVGGNYGLKNILHIDEDEERAIRERLGTPDDKPLAIDYQVVEERDLAVYGDTDHVIDEISGMIEELGYEGLHMILYASLPGMTSEEVKTQMTAFADELVPYLEGEYPSP